MAGRRYLKRFFMELIDKKRASDDEDVFAQDGYFPAKLQHFPFTRPLDNLPLRLVARDKRAATVFGHSA